LLVSWLCVVIQQVEEEFEPKPSPLLVWGILLGCLAVDGMLAAIAISGSDVCIFAEPVPHSATEPIFTDDERLLCGPEPALWPWIYGFTLTQGLLVLALLRSRDLTPSLSLRC